MSKDPEQVDERSDSDTEISFHYLKSSQFRVVHADGGVGGVTPRGGIHLSIFSERPSIPQVVMHKLEADGTLGVEVQSKRIDKRGIVRELEVDLIMNVDTAESIAKWLSEKVQSIRDQGKRISGG